MKFAVNIFTPGKLYTMYHAVLIMEGVCSISYKIYRVMVGETALAIPLIQSFLLHTA